MSAEIYQKTLEYTEITSAALKTASDLLNKQQQKQAAADVSAVEVANLLKSAGLITEGEIKAAVAQAGDQTGALDLLKNVLVHYSEQPVKSASVGITGRGVEASADKPARNTNYMGERTSVKSASDQRLYDRLVKGIK